LRFGIAHTTNKTTQSDFLKQYHSGFFKMTTPQQTRQNIESVFSMIAAKSRSQRELVELFGFMPQTIKSYLKILKKEKFIYIEQYRQFKTHRTVREEIYGVGNLPDAFKTQSKNAKRSEFWRERIRNGYVPTPKLVKVPQPTVLPEFTRQYWFSPLGMYIESDYMVTA
jgi:hypothetical protein